MVSQHLGNRDREISVRWRPAWPIYQDPGQLGLRETLSEKKELELHMVVSSRVSTEN